MRPRFGMPDISDGSSRLPPPPVEGGWLLSTEASPLDPLSPLVVYAVEKNYAFSDIPDKPWSPLASPASYALPMTMHQALYQWPDTGVGPHIEVEGVVKDPVPAPLPPIMDPWGITPVIEQVDGFSPVSLPWAPLTEIPSPSAPPSQFSNQAFKQWWTIRKGNPHFAYSLRGGWRGPLAQESCVISGTTIDSAGLPLGNCRVVVFEASKIMFNADVQGNPVVVETVSDSLGAYSVVVRGGRSYQLIAYKDGSPDVAGITRDDVQAVAA